MKNSPTNSNYRRGAKTRAKVLRELRAVSTAAASELAGLVGICNATAQRHLQTLQAAGLARKTQPTGRGTRWMQSRVRSQP